MVKNAPEDAKSQQALNAVCIKATELLCEFRFDNNDCFAVVLAEGTNLTSGKLTHNGHTLEEICRFNVNGSNCLIMKKTANLPNERQHLSFLLSNRELQIATLVALGSPNKQVADKLHISEWTVATYLRRIFAKLGVDTRAAMVYRCAALIGKQDATLTK